MQRQHALCPINHILPKTRYHGQHTLAFPIVRVKRQWIWCSWLHIVWNNAPQWSMGRSMSPTLAAIESQYATLYQWITQNYMLSCKVSDLSWRIGEIIAFDRGCLDSPFRVNPELWTVKCGPRWIRNTTLSCGHLWCTTCFDILNCLGVDHRWQTDRITIAIACIVGCIAC